MDSFCVVTCSCCGQDRPVVALPSRSDVELCRDCVEWMARGLGVQSTPMLPALDMADAVVFYERAGFGVRVWTEADGTPGGYAFVDFDGQSVFDLGLEPIDPDCNGAGCYLNVADPDAWHDRLVSAGLPVGPIDNQDYGMRDFTLTDPSGNRIRIGHSTED